MPTRTLLVDDEAPVRESLRSLLNTHQSLEIVGEARNGAEAVKLIRDLAVDMVILDVQMPELNGFQVIEQVGAENMPAVIFVSAHDEQVLKAFDVHAVDYLLKPFDRERVLRAVDRAVNQLGGPDAPMQDRLRALLEHMRKDTRYPTRMAVKLDGRTLLIELSTISHIEAANKQVHMHGGGKVYDVRATMRRLEEELDPDVFVRVHRSLMVNTEHVREVQPWFQGAYILMLMDGSKLYSGSGYEANVRRMMDAAHSAKPD